MNRRLNILLSTLFALVSLGFISCSEDEFTPSIFDTTQYPLDRTLYTFPLDTFVKVNFQEPYNVRFIHKMEDISSDKSKNLTPASYEKSCELAVLTKYLWYDVYNKLAPETFLKEYSPRIIHVIGSKNYNSNGTEVLGVAEGGLKISLYKVNSIDVNDIDNLNEYYFKTMHHEFGHILDQTRRRPTAFDVISSGKYNPSSWNEMSDSLTLGQGFISAYASSAQGEDWVEILANYITMDSVTWERSLNTASYEWEEIDYDEALFEKKMPAGYSYVDTVGLKIRKENGDTKIVRRSCVRTSDDAQNVILDEDGNVQWKHVQGFVGKDIILQKLEMVRTWVRERFSVDLDKLRYEVQSRSFVKDGDGKFVLNYAGKPVNKLVTVDPSDSEGRKVIDILLDEINKYKELQ